MRSIQPTVQTYLKTPFSKAKSAFFGLFFLMFLVAVSPVLAQEVVESDTTNQVSGHEVKEDISAVIFGHVLDHHTWHFFDGHYGTLYLPVIVYSQERGLEVFSSRNFFDEHHRSVEYDGYKLVNGKVYRGENTAIDFSITKNVVMLFLTAGLLLLTLTATARAYKRNVGKALPAFSHLWSRLFFL